MNFSIYTKSFVLMSGTVIYSQFIVIIDDNGIRHFTDFGRYIKPSSNLIPENYDGNNAFSFVRMFLEYIFFYSGITTLKDLTIDIVIEFFRLYHTCRLPFDKGTYRSAATQMRCRYVIMNFLSNLIDDGIIPFMEEDMFKTVPRRVSSGHGRGKITNVKVPVIEIVTSMERPHKAVFRDIPDNAFHIIFSYIRTHHPDLLGLIACQSFAGLRPSEACNVRRHDCKKYGPGIRFTQSKSGTPSRIEIDLTRELKLRDDNAYIGKIKKERKQLVPRLFRDAFYQAYTEYIEYCKTNGLESPYGALNVNKQCRTMTYSNYHNRFTKIIREEIVPVFLHSNDEALVEYGRILMENTLSPHVFRHWFTVQLVLTGNYSEVELANARGDRSTESAKAYLENKSELEKRYAAATEIMWEGLKAEAEALIGGAEHKESEEETLFTETQI